MNLGRISRISHVSCSKLQETPENPLESSKPSTPCGVGSVDDRFGSQARFVTWPRAFCSMTWRRRFTSWSSWAENLWWDKRDEHYEHCTWQVTLVTRCNSRQLVFLRIDRELSGDEMSALQDLRSPWFMPHGQSLQVNNSPYDYIWLVLQKLSTNCAGPEDWAMNQDETSCSQIFADFRPARTTFWRPQGHDQCRESSLREIA